MRHTTTQDSGAPRDEGAAPDEAEAPAPEIPLPLWAALVYEARRSRRMTQPQLARAAGVAQQTISKLERGLLCPHDRVKLRLAEALGVQPSVLFPWPSLAELGSAARTAEVAARRPGADGPPGITGRNAPRP